METQTYPHTDFIAVKYVPTRKGEPKIQWLEFAHAK